jgi:hypothetical protein
MITKPELLANVLLELVVAACPVDLLKKYRPTAKFNLWRHGWQEPRFTKSTYHAWDDPRGWCGDFECKFCYLSHGAAR